LTRENAFINFNKIKENNKDVLFPKKFINCGAIKPVKYEIAVSKITEDTDSFRVLRNDAGKIYVEKPIGDWTILHSDEYLIEEGFNMLGYQSRKNKPTIKEVIKKISSGAYKKNMVKQVIVVHNKLVIHNEEQFDMVICKCIEDAQRLHHTLARIAKKQKIKSILFMGTASQASISKMYQIIHENTGWAMTRIRRRTTRP
jgi:hypothetical protein